MIDCTETSCSGISVHAGRLHARFLRQRPSDTGLQRDALIAAGVDARHLFEDKASGARDDRPGLKSCLDFLKSGDTLIVWKLDRLGRSLPHLLDIVAGLRDGGIAFRSLTEGMDTNTPHGELLFHFFCALAQYERALTRERVQAGLAAARRRGRRGGRPGSTAANRPRHGETGGTGWRWPHDRRCGRRPDGSSRI
ncbi:recombinase family protein [Magnetospirillum moscoviense]|uniref:recombinase family protein n=1 Tax=Magnetospirillum moscoviense TaxID=1437059 RepID=UPI003CCC2159